MVQQPYGCVYIIGPYNYPFQLLIEPLVGAIAAGNCAVLSPSELTPHVSAVTMKMIRETFPAEYVCCVDGGIENNTLLLDCAFDYIFFTGSIGVGKIVMQAAAKRLIPVTLELGGKSPVIIEKSANLKIACESLGGRQADGGDIAYEMDMFPFLQVLLRFWDADDEFPPSLQILVDKNILDYMHYETLMFAMTHMLNRLRDEMNMIKK